MLFRSRDNTFSAVYAPYVLEKHALKDGYTQDDVDNFGEEGLRVAVTEHLTDKILLRMEKTFSDLFVDTNWSLNQSLAAAARWSVATTTVNPILDADTATGAVLGNSGMKANFAVMRDSAVKAVKNNVNVLERVKYTSSEISEAMIASLFGVEKLYSSTVQYDSAEYGAADSIGHVFPNACFFGYKSANPGPRSASVGYTFWKEGPNVRAWVDEEADMSNVIEVGANYQPRIVASLAGYLITTVL